MGNGRLERLAPLSGVLFAVIFAVGFLTSGETPDVKSSGAEIIEHYDDAGAKLVVIFGLVLAAVVFLFFMGVLRDALQRTGPSWLASVAFAGGIVYTVALAIFAMGQIMLIDAADLGDPAVAQALNIFDNDNFFPAVVGLAVVLLASGWHLLRSRLLAKWVGWVAVVLGVLALAGPLGFAAFLLFPIWVLIVSVLLYRGSPTTPVVADRAPDAVAT